MPEERTPQQPPEVDLERVPFMYEGQTVDDAAAVKLVRTTFETYEGQRKTHEDRWRTAERLYFGVVEKRKWEGTEVERASLPVMIAFDQVESAFPLITEALFEYYPTFFEVTGVGGTSPQDAAAQRDRLAGFLEEPFDETGVTPMAGLYEAVHQGLLLGDGAVEVTWDERLGRPIVEWVDIKDIYFDLSAPGPLIDLSPAVIRRKLVTVEQLAKLRGKDEAMKIPEDAVLNFMAKQKFQTQADLVKREGAAARKERFDPGEIRTDPRHREIEVLMYWTKDRLMWILNRVWCALNVDNPFGFIPFCKAPFSIVSGRPYAMSLPDVLEGEQKYAQGIRNARLDNLALAIHKPRWRAQGTPLVPSKIAWKPGLVDEVQSKDSVGTYEIEDVTANAYREEQLIHAQASKRTGINEMVQSGIPVPSNANRNATGVMQQARAVNQRLRTAVKNFETYLIIPMLYKMQSMIGKLGGETKPVQFKMEAASRMVTKDRLAMFLGPVSQLLFNEAVMRQANLQGKTLDFGEWVRFFQDATATAKTYQFFRPMSGEEKKAAMQPDPKTMMEFQKAQLEAQTRVQMGQMKSQTELQTAKMETEAKLTETGEKSARELSKVLAQVRGDNGSNGEKANSKSAK